MQYLRVYVYVRLNIEDYTRIPTNIYNKRLSVVDSLTRWPESRNVKDSPKTKKDNETLGTYWRYAIYLDFGVHRATVSASGYREMVCAKYPRIIILCMYLIVLVDGGYRRAY